jgi:hypothetical protein
VKSKLRRRRGMRKRNIRSILSLSIAGAMFVCMPITALASQYDISNSPTGITIQAVLNQNGNTIYRVNSNDINGSEIKITGRSTNSDQKLAINTAQNTTVYVILSGLKISLDEDNDCAVSIIGDGNVVFKLEGENRLVSGDSRAAIEKCNTGSLTIENYDDQNPGSLVAQGGSLAAGIGGGSNGSASNIIIEGGNIEATGGFNGAGIGGGCYGDGNNITIKGGNIKATGGNNGAGIGGGYEGDADYITINGGTIKATGGQCGAGIGGGADGVGDHIEINGGTIEATGGQCGAGIGGGELRGAFVSINGGNVTAAGQSGGAGIGCGQRSDTVSVTVSGDAVIKAAGSNCSVGDSAAIGAGAKGSIGSGAELDLDVSNLYTTGSVTRFAAGTSVQEMKDNPENGTTVRGLKPAPAKPVETVNNETKEESKETKETKEKAVKSSAEKKVTLPEYTERSCIADVDVAALIATALKANPGAKEINIEFNDNICMTPDLMKDLFKDSRVAKNCFFVHKGIRYNLRIGAVDMNSAACKEAFDVLSKEPDGLAGFKRMAQIFNSVGVTLTEIK